MIGEFGSSNKENEAVLSCQELLSHGATAPAVHATLLCELTSVYKDAEQFAEKRDAWLQVRAPKRTFLGVPLGPGNLDPARTAHSDHHSIAYRYINSELLGRQIFSI